MLIASLRFGFMVFSKGKKSKCHELRIEGSHARGVSQVLTEVYTLFILKKQMLRRTHRAVPPAFLRILESEVQKFDFHEVTRE